MYNITMNGQVIYDDRSMDITGYVLINPVLVIEDNSAGSLSFSVPPTHPLYSLFGNDMRAKMKVFNDDEIKPVWTGRIMSIEEDFWKRKKVFCEGALAFLSDCVGQDDTARLYGSLPFSPDYGVEVAKVWLNYALRGYNELSWISGGETHKVDKVENRFKIFRGAVTVSIPNSVDMNHKARPYHDSTSKTCYQKVMELQQNYGGHMNIDQNNDGDITLNWFKDYWGTGTESDFLAGAKLVHLGENLLDLIKNRDISDIFTVLRPFGAEIENPLKNSYTDVTPSRNAGYYLTKSGSFASTSDTNYVCSNTIEIDSELSYFFSGDMKAQGSYGAYYAILDENSNALYVKTAEEKLNQGVYETTKIDREEVVMPPYARYIRLCWYLDETAPKLETMSPNADDKSYVDVSSLTHTDSPDLSPYITVNQTLFNQYGWIEKTLHFDTVNRAEGLYQTAKKYISGLSFLETTFQVKYIDLGSVEGTDWKPPKLYDPLHVISEAHGIDTYFFITKLNIPMDKPQNMTITVGGSLYKPMSKIVADSRKATYSSAESRRR